MTSPLPLPASPADVLRKARALIDSPEKWTQHTWARWSNGEQCTIGARSAAQFSAGGTLCRVTVAPHKSSDPKYRKQFEALEAAENILVAVVGMKVEAWNDAPERTHAEVLEAFDRAIALAESRAT